MKKLLKQVWRVGPGFLGQGCLSVSNVLLLAFVTSRVTGDIAGLFTVAYVGLAFVQTAARGGIGDAVALGERDRSSREEGPIWTKATTTGAFVIVGILSALVLTLYGLTFASGARSEVLTLAVSAPFLFYQDGVRAFLNIRGQYGLSAAQDLLALVLFAVVGVTSAVSSAMTAVLCWALSSVVGGALGYLLASSPAGLRSASKIRVLMLRENGLPIVNDIVASRGPSQMAYVWAGGLVGAQSAATLRVADSVLGPLNVVLQGFQTIALVEFARRVEITRREVKWLGVFSLLLGILMLAIGLFASTLDSALWVSFFGESGAALNGVLVPFAVTKLVLSLNVGATVAMRLLGRLRVTARIRWCSGVVVLLAVPMGAFTGEVSGIAWAALTGPTVSSLILWRLALSSSSDENRV